jgi:hypothetical protein
VIQKRAAGLLELFQGFTLSHGEPIHNLQCMERCTPLVDLVWSQGDADRSEWRTSHGVPGVDILC